MPRSRIVLARQAELDERLQHQALGEQQVVLGLDARRDVARLADDTRWPARSMNLRRQALDADGQPRCARLGRASKRTPATTSHHGLNERPKSTCASAVSRTPSTASPSVRNQSDCRSPPIHERLSQREPGSPWTNCASN